MGIRYSGVQACIQNKGLFVKLVSMINRYIKVMQSKDSKEDLKLRLAICCHSSPGWTATFVVSPLLGFNLPEDNLLFLFVMC